LQVFLGQNDRGYVQVLCPLQCVSIGLVTDDKGYMDVMGVGKIADDVLAVAAAAGNEDGDVHEMRDERCEMKD
jgi:hypothetical protein